MTEHCRAVVLAKPDWGTMKDRSPSGYLCTLPVGHEGRHIWMPEAGQTPTGWLWIGRVNSDACKQRIEQLTSDANTSRAFEG